MHCGNVYDYDDFRMDCSEEHEASLLRTEYSKKLIIHDDAEGIFRYSDWLPLQRKFKGTRGPVVYHSKGLGSRLGLDNLYVAFNGYWPERGAFMETCSFKELEVPGVCGRLPESEERVLVVSSAGNTGRAFLTLCSRNDIPVLVVVPDKYIHSLWSTEELSPRVKLLSVKGNVDYLDAIKLGGLISHFDGFLAEGGAKNVGRRDGMGVVVLAGTEAIGEIPDHYFQAVGSGTGGIAAWEMSLRLLEDGSFGKKRMHLHLSQNIPFTPMVEAWKRGERRIDIPEEKKTKRLIDGLHSKVLSNRKPPYSIVGGVFDALTDSKGHMYGVTNEESLKAGFMFEKEEGIDLDPAAEVAVASLIQAVEAGNVKKKDVILLNITGGGYKRLSSEKKPIYKEPDLSFTPNESDDFIRNSVEKLFQPEFV